MVTPALCEPLSPPFQVRPRGDRRPDAPGHDRGSCSRASSAPDHSERLVSSPGTFPVAVPGRGGAGLCFLWHLVIASPVVGERPMPFSQATPGMPGADAARKSQHTRQLGVNLFSDVKKIRLRDRNLTSEKILTCYRPDPAPKGRAAARPATPQAKRHWGSAGRKAECSARCPLVRNG